MKNKKLTTTINSKCIYKSKKLSLHTKNILYKMITDIICGNEEPSFLYMQANIFTVWPENIVWKAIDELLINDIMYIDFIDEDEEQEYEDEDEGYQMEELVFNPEFLEKIYPAFDSCPCCNPAPVNFNVNYN